MAINLLAFEQAALNFVEKERRLNSSLRSFRHNVEGHALARSPRAVMFPLSRLGRPGWPEPNDFSPTAPSKQMAAERFLLGRGLILRSAVTRG